MKRIIFLVLIFVAVVFCTTGQNRAANKIKFDSIVVQEKIKLLPNEPDSLPYAKLNIKFVYPTSFGTKEQLQKLQSVFYENVFYVKANTLDEAISAYKNNYASMYRKDITDDFNELLLSNGEEARTYIDFAYSNSSCNKIEYQNESLLSFSEYSENYYGGAHEMYSFMNVVINLNTIEKIEEADIFIPDYKEPLARIIREKIMKNMIENIGGDEADLRESFFDFDNISSNENFLMDDKGLRYVYSYEEIASYAAGMIDVFIPYSEIAHLLNTDVMAELFPDMYLKEYANKSDANRGNYNDFPVAYVKKGELHFFNPENGANVRFTQETDSVFNCVYSDKDAMFYYSVSQGGKFKLKQVDLSDISAQPKLLFELNKPTSEFFSEVFGDKAALKYINDNLLLECDFVLEDFNFTKFYNYSISSKTVDKIDWDQFENKYGYHPYYSENENKIEDYPAIYNMAKHLDVSKYINEEYADFEKEYYLQDISADGSKVVFSITITLGDIAYGPSCVANADCTNIRILEGTQEVLSTFAPLWCNNNLLFRREVNVDDENSIREFCYTRAADNTVARIDQDVDYYAVRTKHPIK